MKILILGLTGAILAATAYSLDVALTFLIILLICGWLYFLFGPGIFLCLAIWSAFPLILAALTVCSIFWGLVETYRAASLWVKLAGARSNVRGQVSEQL